MAQLILTLMEHPVLFTFVLLAVLSFIGMTYEFILRLFNRNSLLGDGKDKENLDLGEDHSDGMEDSGVPQNPDPDDILHVGEKTPSTGIDVYCNETKQEVEWVKNKDYGK